MQYNKFKHKDLHLQKLEEGLYNQHTKQIKKNVKINNSINIYLFNHYSTNLKSFLYDTLNKTVINSSNDIFHCDIENQYKYIDILYIENDKYFDDV